MPALKDIGEREAVEQLKRILDRGLPVGLGHDAGVVDWGEDYLAVTTDVVNARTHVPPGTSPAQIGWYLVAVNLSDLAAAGARPLEAEQTRIASSGSIGSSDRRPTDRVGQCRHRAPPP